jgi:23S rRNA pseudouridine2605 synthase
MQHGKKREIRLLFSALGYIVQRLRRYQIGAVRLKGIPLRGAKQLASKEIEQLFKSPRTPQAELQATAPKIHSTDED